MNTKGADVNLHAELMQKSHFNLKLIFHIIMNASMRADCSVQGIQVLMITDSSKVVVILTLSYIYMYISSIQLMVSTKDIQSATVP